MRPLGPVSHLRGYRAFGVKMATRLCDSRRDASRCDRARPDHAWNAGVEVLRALRDRNYSGGVIIMTGSHNEELLGEAWSLGPQEILIKPVDLERLLTAIQLVLVCREC